MFISCADAEECGAIVRHAYALFCGVCSHMDQEEEMQQRGQPSSPNLAVKRAESGGKLPILPLHVRLQPSARSGTLDDIVAAELQLPDVDHIVSAYRLVLLLEATSDDTVAQVLQYCEKETTRKVYTLADTIVVVMPTLVVERNRLQTETLFPLPRDCICFEHGVTTANVHDGNWGS